MKQLPGKSITWQIEFLCVCDCPGDATTAEGPRPRPGTSLPSGRRPPGPPALRLPPGRRQEVVPAGPVGAKGTRGAGGSDAWGGKEDPWEATRSRRRRRHRRSGPSRGRRGGARPWGELCLGRCCSVEPQFPGQCNEAGQGGVRRKARGLLDWPGPPQTARRGSCPSVTVWRQGLRR